MIYKPFVTFFSVIRVWWSGVTILFWVLYFRLWRQRHIENYSYSKKYNHVFTYSDPLKIELLFSLIHHLIIYSCILKRAFFRIKFYRFCITSILSDLRGKLNTSLRQFDIELDESHNYENFQQRNFGKPTLKINLKKK